MIKAVIFDLDNTVYDYDFCHNKSMSMLCSYACQSFSLTEEQFYKLFDNAKEDVKNQLGEVGASHNRILYMQVLSEFIGLPPTKYALAMYDVYWNTMLDNMTLFPYVKELMGYLKSKGIVIAVLTDLTAHIQHRKIQRLGLDNYIDVLVTSEEAGQEKPSKVAFERVIRKLKFEPEEILMIGDSLSKDIKGAEHMGMNAIMFSLEDAEHMGQKVKDYIDDRKIGR